MLSAGGDAVAEEEGVGERGGRMSVWGALALQALPGRCMFGVTCESRALAC